MNSLIKDIFVKHTLGKMLAFLKNDIILESEALAPNRASLKPNANELRNFVGIPFMGIHCQTTKSGYPQGVSLQTFSIKKTLLKTLLLFLGLSFLLHSEDFSYQFKINNTTPYLKEALSLSLEVNQTNHNIVLMFNFDVKKSPHYYFQRIGEKEKKKHHNLSIIYDYLIYPLKKGEVNIEFELVKKVTTDDKVAYSFSGDRDNVKGLVTTDTAIILPPLTLYVKPLPKETQIVGDFKLGYTFSTHQANPYQPIGFKLNLIGLGYPPIIKKLFPHKVDFKLFRETPTNTPIVTQKGIKNTLIYSMALSATKDFIMPKVTIKAFNPTLKKSYILTIPSQNFKIVEAKELTLVDKVDSPKPLSVNWSWIENILQCLVVFLAGYFTHFSLTNWTKKTSLSSKKTPHPLVLKIEKVKDEKSLLQLLLSSQIKAFTPTITLLEDAIYHQKEINLKEIKKALKESLQ